MNSLQRRRVRLLIKRTQPFADEPLVAAANFTWVGTGTGSPGALGREDLAGGLPTWTLIGAGATRLYVVEADLRDPDRGTTLYNSWPLNQIVMAEDTLERTVGQSQIGVYQVVRFSFAGVGPVILQPFGREVDGLIAAHRAAQPNAGSPDLH